MKGERTIIFDMQLNGHHLEYIHHLYEEARSNPQKEYIFILPKDFETKKNKFTWKEISNVRFDLVEQKIVDKCMRGSSITSSFKKSRFLAKKVKEYDANFVFLIMFMSYLPFLPFCLSQNVKVSGIVYRIYLYRWRYSSVIQKIQDVLKYELMKYSRKIERVFILNDKSAAIYLNWLYKTNKFHSVIDPVMEVDTSVRNLRRELSIPDDADVFLHFGGLDFRKGTMDVLNAILLLPSNLLDKTYFIFAGKVNEDMKIDFYQKVDELKENAHLLVFDEFCEYHFLSSLCYSANCLLLPYKNTIQSSGVIGYGALYRKPVITAYEGLLGKLVRKNHLGLTIQNINAEKIAYLIIEGKWKTYSVLGKYAKMNTVVNFVNCIMNK